MFTGLIQAVGRVERVSETADRRIEIGCDWRPQTIKIGASIACSGVCLTVVETGLGASGPWFAVEASAETVARTNLGNWGPGSRVNLEPSLRVGDELGGHIVSGHVDGLAEVTEVRPEGGSHRLSLSVAPHLARFIASKGSVALDGISLTVNEVEDGPDGTQFGVNIIPHTWAVTTLAHAAPGSRLNLEIDVLARYVARLDEVD